MLLRCLVLTSAIATVSWTYMCPEPYICRCEGITFNCTCNSRQNVTVSALYNFDIRHVVIKGCGTVSISFGSLSFIPLETIELSDLEVLKVSPFALSGLHTLEYLRISGIQDMSVDTRGFSALFNVSEISISNVSWTDMQAESFGGVSNVGQFAIADSNFGTVQSLSFILNNVTSFSVKNSYFKTVENMSLLIHGAEEVSYENCEFEETGYSAFSMSFVERLTFQSCNFDVFATSAIFGKSMNFFNFNNCSVNVLETHAFRNVEVSNLIQFSNNVVNVAKVNSLYFRTHKPIGRLKSVEKNVKCNRFTCDCNLTWLWENQHDIYKDFIDSSLCIGSLDNFRLSSLSSVLSSKTECSDLPLVSTDVSQREELCSPSRKAQNEDSRTQPQILYTETGTQLYEFETLPIFLTPIRAEEDGVPQTDSQTLNTPSVAPRKNKDSETQPQILFAATSAAGKRYLVLSLVITCFMLFNQICL